MDVYIQGKRITLNPKKVIGEGGEAKIYFHGNRAIKIYHAGFMTKRRESKLKAFPQNTPTKLISPVELATDIKGSVVGFSMEMVAGAESFIMLSNKNFRANFSSEKVLKILLDALETLKNVHAAAMVVGDLNDLNLLFKQEDAFFIDADSMQFGQFPCEVATEQFLDPRLYGVDFSGTPVFTAESDYYAFAVMLFKSLLLINPYGGVHKKYPTFLRRAENRISVFDAEVKYPKTAVPFKVLPDELLDYFQKVFEKDLRGEFPKKLLADLRWTKCAVCGEMHARAVCPFCAQRAPAATKQVAIVNRKCIATIIFETRGRIITAKMENGKLKFVYEEDGIVRRENGEILMANNPDNFTLFSIMGSKTLIGKRSKIVVVEKEKVVGQVATGMLGNLPVFATNEADFFRLQGDMLIRGEDKIIGNILENQTWIKAGPKFGLGFYRVGQKTVYFIFDALASGINDTVDLPNPPAGGAGQLIDAECIFSESHALFLTSTMESGKVVNAMYLIDAKGGLVAGVREEAENSTILAQIHNKVLSGSRIITATDEGLMLLEAAQGTIREMKLFSDTEPFVDESLRVFLAPEGLYAVSGKDVKLLKLI